MGAPENETPLERRLRVQREVAEKAEQYRLYLRTSAAGLEFGLAIAVGALLGYFADRWLETGPWGLFIGLGFGLAASIRTLYHVTRKSMADDETPDEAASAAPPGSDEAGDVRLG